jgi:mono/diheme cytochrome c family protein
MMKKTIILAIAILICSALYFVSCSSRRVKKDMSIEQDQKAADGRSVFKNKCQKCHPNGEAGVGPALNNKKLPSFFIRAKVRSRATFIWTGKMPAFDKHEISKIEMDALIAYLKYMEKKDK